jgi:hypothetical protein
MGLVGAITGAGSAIYGAGKKLVEGTVGNVYNGAGFGGAPDDWADRGKDTDAVRDIGANTYSAAMDAYDRASNVPQTAVNAPDAVTAQTVRAGQMAGVNPITAQQIATPGIIGGQEATDLRAQQLDQAEKAAGSPSAAAAQMRANLAQIARTQGAMAATARGADRGAAKRDAMLGVGQVGMEAANSTAAMAAQENLAKQNAYSAALAGVRAGDVSATNAYSDIGKANASNALTADQQTTLNAINAQKANLDAQMKAQELNQAADLSADKANSQSQLDASQYTAANALNAYKAQQDAQNAYLGTAQGGGQLQNQVNQVEAAYATGQNTLQQGQNQQAARTTGGILSALGLPDGGLSQTGKTDGGGSDLAGKAKKALGGLL